MDDVRCSMGDGGRARCRFLIACGLLLAVWLAPGVAAQPIEAEAAERLVGDYTGAVAAGQWQRAADMVDPEGVEFVRTFLVTMAASESGAYVLPMLTGNLKPDEVGRWPGSKLFARMMQTMGENVPVFGQVLGGTETEIIGSVPEGEDTQHVVVRSRLSMEGVEMNMVDAKTVVQRGGRLYIALPEELHAMIGMLGAEAEAAPVIAPSDAP